MRFGWSCSIRSPAALIGNSNCCLFTPALWSTGDADWPPVTDAAETTWKEAKAALQQSYETLHAHILNFPEDRLDEPVPDTTYSFYVMLHGVVQHDLYHAGQIALLKKAT